MKRLTKAVLTSAAVLAVSFCAASCIFLPQGEEKLEFSKDRKKVTIGSQEYKLKWSDEFDDDALDSENWNRVVWPKGKVNDEVQAYSADAQYSVVKDGTLKIYAKGSGGTWTSARIDTSDKQKFKYGYFEARIKQPVAYKNTTESEGNLLLNDDGEPVNNGVWPAFWMMPNAYEYENEDGELERDEHGAYGIWPRSGEIDIMEYSPTTHGTSAYATYHHFDATKARNDGYSSLGEISVKTPVYDDDSDWHTYGMLWTDGILEAYYDGKSLGTFYVNANSGSDQWPYDQDFYLILNLAMGGSLGGGINSGMKMAVYEIDYVRVYQK